MRTSGVTPWVGALIFVVVIGCDSERARVEDEMRIARASESAAAAAQALGVALMGELSKALAPGVPEDAVNVCARLAGEITDRTSTDQGVRVRRTALRFRNPKNAPDDWERARLEQWAQVEDASTIVPFEEVVTTRAGRELRQLRPIVLLELCTTCHGDRESMSQSLRTRIAAHYPDDAAVGFATGDLRGAFSVRVPIEED